MSLHPSLHKALLAGLARAPLAAELGADEALSLLFKNNGHPALLWQALAANDLWQRAGYQPQPLPQAQQASAASSPSPAGAEAGAAATPEIATAPASATAPTSAATPAPAPADLRTCPPAVERVLMSILRGIHSELLGSWLQQARDAQLRLPHSCLVPLLEMGLSPQKAALRPAIAALLDQRGAWLVRQHPQWSEVYGTAAATSAHPGVQWQLGNLTERVLALRALRQQDPGAARALLETDWPNEAPDQRAALLPSLAAQLSLADEAFLERALDDKRKEVRVAAQQLLASLPGSLLSQRCVARLSTLLTVERKTGLAAQLGGLIGRIGGDAAPNASLVVTLPESCDKAMQRDGIGTQTYPLLGEKAGWLRDLLRRVPPQHWSDAWQLTPPQVIALMRGHEFHAALLGGLAQATASALRFAADATTLAWYAELIVIDDAGAAAAHQRETPATLLRPELGLLPVAAQEQVVLGWLERPDGDLAAHQHVLEWSRQHGGALSPALSRRLLLKLQSLLHGGDSGLHWLVRSQLAALAHLLDVSDPAYLDQHWPEAHWEPWPQWRKAVDDFLDTLRFRHAMQRSFLENPA